MALITNTGVELSETVIFISNVYSSATDGPDHLSRCTDHWRSVVCALQESTSSSKLHSLNWFFFLRYYKDKCRVHSQENRWPRALDARHVMSNSS